jgi:hypothetical protein
LNVLLAIVLWRKHKIVTYSGLPVHNFLQISHNIYSPTKVKHHLTCCWMFCLQLFCDESIRSWLTVDYLFIIFCRYPTIYTVRQKLSTTWLVAIISFLIMNLFQIGLLFSLPVHTYLPVKQVIDRFLFVWHFFQ